MRRNDEIDADAAERLAPSHLVISPGPGRPGEPGRRSRSSAGSHRRCRRSGCLGHQAIVEAFGGEIGQAQRLVHGKASAISHDGSGIFAGLPQAFQAARYHSLAADARLRGAGGLGDDRGRRGDGGAPPHAARRRRPVSPGIRADPGRPAPLPQLPGGTVIQHALAGLLDGRRAHARRRPRCDGLDHDRRGDAGADRRVPRRAAVKGETPDEIAGFAEAIRGHVLAVRPQRNDLVDTAGTGGDGQATINISTGAALVAAAAGAAVAKHGNRAVSSASGSADVLEALGFSLERRRSALPARSTSSASASCSRRRTTPASVTLPLCDGSSRRERCSTCSARSPTRRARARRSSASTSRPSCARSPRCSSRLGARRAFVVHGAFGIDELSPAGPNLVCEVVDGGVRERERRPARPRRDRCAPEELRGGSPGENAAAIRAIFAGEERRRTPRRDPAQRGGRDRRRRPRRGPARRAGARARDASTPEPPRSGSTRSSPSRSDG